MPPTSQPRALHVACADQEAGCDAGGEEEVENPSCPTWHGNEELQGVSVTHAMNTCVLPGSPRWPSPTTYVFGLLYLLLSSQIYLAPLLAPQAHSSHFWKWEVAWETGHPGSRPSAPGDWAALGRGAPFSAPQFPPM